MKLSRKFALSSVPLVCGVLACGAEPAEPSETRSKSEPLTICDSAHAIFQEPLPLTPTPCKIVNSPTGVWQGSHLFSATAPLRLRRHCAYDWIPNVPGGPPDVTTLVQTKPGAELDCPVVATLASDLSDEPAIWKPLRQTFRTQAGRASSLAPTKARTRVAVLDTAAVPYDDFELDNNPHGRAVGRAIADLTCAGKEDLATGCVAEISNHPALRRTPDGVDDSRGGHFGTRGDLARALYDAVLDWQHDWASQQTIAERLVVNMSLGWAPEWGGGTDPKYMPKPALAVWDVLEFVRCHGALLVAAAGNYSDPYSKGPMYPALWEQMPAPSASTCGGLVTSIPGGHAAFAGSEGGMYRPLVVAAGGVDWQDLPLGNSRELGQPRLLGYAQAVTTDDVRSNHTRLLSGSSMSAATTSGAAATAWAYNPKLSATELLEILYDTGTTLDSGPTGMGRGTEFCLGESCSSYPPKRVSVCAATHRAACGDASSCSSEPGCWTVPAHAGDSAALPADWTVFGGFTTLASLPCSGDCNTETGVNQVLIPSVGPQPGIPGCDICVLDLSTYQLWVSMEARLAEISTVIVLTTTDGRYSSQSRIPRPDGAPFPTRFNTTVTPLPGATYAYLDFVMNDGTVLLDSRVSIPIRRP